MYRTLPLTRMNPEDILYDDTTASLDNPRGRERPPTLSHTHMPRPHSTGAALQTVLAPSLAGWSETKGG
ncbi:MAG: hypothetical protein J07HQW1_03494 [Haloquadratum walsbyi J07HQW1]|uniref:Uncharacterized protein n=1 Tax=Haloquadratum walsbyi J07HQW1 TaxID=1238424 RepID=U1PIG6_9EURY|nr:MAG: hypothetical protein J07HQW1_03494 [Haloquadratum walsbyi J07HQW1]